MPSSCRAPVSGANWQTQVRGAYRELSDSAPGVRPAAD
jgi:hypothetical protein